MVPHFVAAGEADLADSRVAREKVAHLAAGTSQAGQGLGRRSRFQQNLHQLEGRQRSVGGRLDHHGVAAGQSGSHLVADQVQRKVERGDGRHHAAGHPQSEAQAAGAAGSRVQGEHLAGDPLGLLSREPDDLGRPHRFDPGLRQDLALLGTDGPGQFLGPLVHDVRRPGQDSRPVVGRHAPHHAGPLDGAGQGCIHVGGAGLGNGVHYRVVVRIPDFDHLGRLGPLALHEHSHGFFSLPVRFNYLGAGTPGRLLSTAQTPGGTFTVGNHTIGSGGSRDPRPASRSSASPACPRSGSGYPVSPSGDPGPT